MRRWLAAAVLVWSWACGSAFAEPAPPRRVILMIADGAGFNAFTAVSMFEGRVGKQVYDGPGWVRLAATTYPLRFETQPGNTGLQDERLVYNPAKAWDATPVDTVSNGFPDRFHGYAWAKNTWTDSAAAATLMATGVRTYNFAINIDDFGKPLKSIVAIADEQGLSTGVVTSVDWSHATPAALGGAHAGNRAEMALIANQLLSGELDVVMGAGHPEYDVDGRPATQPAPADYTEVGGEATWRLLKSGEHPGGWMLIDTRERFARLSTGATPKRVLGVAPVRHTLQYQRTTDAPVATVPDLPTMTLGALNVLDDNPRGFYLMVEGGAVDWALHYNNAPRLIEEMGGFLRAVEAVVNWIEANGGWDHTLLIITADHDHYYWGTGSDVTPFAPLQDRGKGNVPDIVWHSNTHGNQLVPVYARGLNAEMLRKRATRSDPVYGPYLDLGDVFHVTKATINEKR